MSERFDGTWAIDLAASRVWDDKLGRHVEDAVGQEAITITTRDNVQDYEVLYGDSPRIRMGYTARFDDPRWVSYSVREIASTASDVQADLASFKQRIKASEGDRERFFEVGKSYGLVRLVYVDERTHYRVFKSPVDGKAQVMMLRRLAEDGQSYVATVLDVEGIVYRIRKFVRA
ncbi:MAG: hypothetical protein JWQ11_3023 [Rhizobacter sp.]|nr:hypothetical protein [Rhizobacter sp.]